VLCPTGSEKEGHYFLSLNMGKKVNKYDWMELPMQMSHKASTPTGSKGRKI